MTQIGYVIGLGDRHLDNILVDFERAEVVHIDYNVSFEKGKRLRIPETVPFRLSRVIVNAFGVTGVEGVYRTTCIESLKNLLRITDTILTLLSSFLYDPPLEWIHSSGNLDAALSDLLICTVIFSSRYGTNLFDCRSCIETDVCYSSLCGAHMERQGPEASR